MARLWAKTVTFESVAVGDHLPILVKWETEETISHFVALVAAAAPPDASDPPEAGGDLDQDSPVTAQAPAPALIGYITELLEKGFPVASILALGSRLEIQTIAPVRAGDTIALSGQVVGKQEEEGRRLVECEIIVENQDNETVARAVATVCL